MQCYQYLAIRQYARRFLDSARDRYDDLDLADTLDELEIESFQDVVQLVRARIDGKSTRQ